MNKLKLIRGARILQQIQLHERATFKDLERRTLAFQPPSEERQHAVNLVKVTKVELVPARNSQTLIAKITVTGEQGRYVPTLEFDNVMFEDADQSDNTSFTAVDGEEYHIIPIQLEKNTVKVNCNCLDFYYRFAPYNNKQDALYGNPPPPYRRRTLTHPPANIQQTPGLCKHLLKAAITLRDVRIVR